MNAILSVKPEHAKHLLDDFMEVYIDKGHDEKNRDWNINVSCVQDTWPAYRQVIWWQFQAENARRMPESWFMSHRLNMPEEMKRSQQLKSFWKCKADWMHDDSCPNYITSLKQNKTINNIKQND